MLRVVVAVVVVVMVVIAVVVNGIGGGVEQRADGCIVHHQIPSVNTLSRLISTTCVSVMVYVLVVGRGLR